MGYYIEQIENNYKENFDNAVKAIDEDVNSLYNTFKSILNENDFPSRAEERWSSWAEQLKTIATQLKTDIESKYQDMVTNANTWQGWYDDLKSVEGDAGGNAGLEFAYANGFKPLHDARVGWAYANAIWHDKPASYLMDLAGIERTTSEYGITKKVTLYSWTAYSSVEVDENGYIKITMTRRQMEKVFYDNDTYHINWEKVIGTKTVIVKSQEDYDTYYTGRGGSIY